VHEKICSSEEFVKQMKRNITSFLSLVLNFIIDWTVDLVASFYYIHKLFQTFEA